MVELKGKKLLFSAIMALLITGGLAYNSLPEAYCPLEDKTVRYVYMSESHKTVTKVIPSDDEGGYSISDDRCQKGREIGQWIPLNTEGIKNIDVECNPIVIAYTDNGKYFCDGLGIDANCFEDKMVELPIN